MKVNKITVVDKILTIELDLAPSDISKLYLDSMDNSDNNYSLDERKHDCVVLEHTIEGNNIIIDSSELQPELDLSAFTVYVDGVLGFYYDDKEVYYKLVDLLVLYCDGCLDKELKENVVVFMLRYNMLQYAIENNLLEDLINIYKDIARLIGIDTKHNLIMCSGKCKRVNGNCKNGVCNIC